jgi:hypothetical protein
VHILKFKKKIQIPIVSLYKAREIIPGITIYLEKKNKNKIEKIVTKLLN